MIAGGCTVGGEGIECQKCVGAALWEGWVGRRSYVKVGKGEDARGGGKRGRSLEREGRVGVWWEGGGEGGRASR